MNKRQKVFTISITIILIIFSLYGYYHLNYSSKGILNNVTNRKGYSLFIQQEQVPIEIYIKPEWISYNTNEQKKLGIKVLDIYNTNIILDNVWNRGNDIYFSFHATFNMKYGSGEFLYNGIFNEDGTFSCPSSGKILLYDKIHKMIATGQTGYGPGADFSFGINPEEQMNIKNGFYVTYTGYILYGYSKQ